MELEVTIEKETLLEGLRSLEGDRKKQTYGSEDTYVPFARYLAKELETLPDTVSVECYVNRCALISHDVKYAKPDNLPNGMPRELAGQFTLISLDRTINFLLEISERVDPKIRQKVYDFASGVSRWIMSAYPPS